MRAGKLDRAITIERVTTAIDAYGTPKETWAPVAMLRAELTQENATEFIFRTRFLDGITTADRVTYADTPLAIKEVKEIGRRRELEIRAVQTVLE
jgi:head-tail adaptor